MTNNRIRELDASDMKKVDEWIKQNSKLYYYYYLKVKLEKKGIITKDEKEALNKKIHKVLLSIYEIRHSLFGTLKDIDNEEDRNFCTLKRINSIMEYIRANCSINLEEIIQEDKSRYSEVGLKNPIYPAFMIYNLLKQAASAINDEDTQGKDPYQNAEYFEETRRVSRIQYAIIEMLENSGIISVEVAEVAKWHISTIIKDLEDEIYDNDYSTHVDVNRLLANRKTLPAHSLNSIVEIGQVTALESAIMFEYNSYAEKEKIQKLTALIMSLSNMADREYKNHKEDVETERELGEVGPHFIEVMDIAFNIADAIRMGESKGKETPIKIKAKAIEL